MALSSVVRLLLPRPSARTPSCHPISLTARIDSEANHKNHQQWVVVQINHEDETNLSGRWVSRLPSVFEVRDRDAIR